MRKAILAIFIIFLTASSGFAATKMYGRDCTGATGDTCTNSMADISGASAGDWCTVPNENDKTVTWYYYSASGISENYPDYIDDDNDGGTAGWTLYRGNVRGNVQFHISDPENLPTHAGRSTKSVLVWYNNTGLTFKITSVRAIADTDDYTFDLFYSASATDISTTNDVRVETSSFVCSTNGTAGYYLTYTSGFEQPNIPTSRYLIFQHFSGTAESVHIYIQGYLY